VFSFWDGRSKERKPREKRKPGTHSQRTVGRADGAKPPNNATTTLPRSAVKSNFQCGRSAEPPDDGDTTSTVTDDELLAARSSARGPETSSGDEGCAEREKQKTCCAR